MYNPLKSKTNITLTIIIAITVAQALIPFMPADWQATITAILSVFAIIFHTNTATQAGVTN